MKEIIIRNQEKIDGLPNKFDEYTIIRIESEKVIVVKKSWGNSSVVARDRVSVQVFSENSSNLLFASAIAIVSKFLKHKIRKKSKYSHIHIVGKLDWFSNNGIQKKDQLILFKRVSNDFKTQEGTPNETIWRIGTVVEHDYWEPKSEECGTGKFHACSKPYFCDEFRNNRGDIYIAIKVALKDVYVWPNPQYPHKIGFRKGKVLYECDRFGNKK